MVTMLDVARLAGVSITTVSHVVNGTRTVAPETKARVLDAVEATGYTGNAIARSLVTGGTRSLGVAISLGVNPYFADLIQAIESEAAAAGYTLLLADTHDEADTEQETVRALRSRRIDGLLLAPSAGATGGVLPELRQLGVPTVLIDRLPERPRFDGVGPENVRAMTTLVRHLGELGHRRIGLISGAVGLSTTVERVRGYRLGLRHCELGWSEELVASGESASGPAGSAVERLLALPDPPTAVVVGNNAMLVGALRTLRAQGVRVGAELALVGYDEVEWASLVDPPLTTIAQPIEQIGRTAVRTLLGRIADPAGAPRTIRLAGRLMHRQSCGCGLPGAGAGQRSGVRPGTEPGAQPGVQPGVMKPDS